MTVIMTKTIRIAVFGASGDVGRRMVAEAIQRGHYVTAIARRLPSPGLHDETVSDLTLDVESADDLEKVVADYDFVISALRPRDGEEAKLVQLTTNVVEAAQAAGKPFLVVGGAASLRIPSNPEQTVLTAPGFLPEAVVPIATACQQQHDWLLPRLGTLGTYICPPAMLTPGIRTGSYRLGAESLVTDDDGNSYISMEDFAVAALDEIENRSHIGQQFTVGT